MMYEDLTGQKFGRLTVLKYAGRTPNRVSLWLCKCACGNEKIIKRSSLKSGATTSCGCYNKEINIKKNTKHNMSRTRLYRIWQNMKRRCKDPKFKNFKHYGGKGVTVCNEWLNNPQNFIDWALSNGYADNLTIDRIDVNGNYEPSNCRWITQKKQLNNRSNCDFYTINNETHTLTEWCEIYSAPIRRTRRRVVDDGWDIITALTTPPLKRNREPL